MDSAAHVLFVEDDPEIRALVADLLGQSGFRVTVAQDGEQMDQVMAADPVDLLILDIMLPKEDGISLCRRVRAAGNLPVIMLTARGSEVDRVVGLEMGADDYLAKPFSSHELVARIRALLRRAQYAAPEPRARRRSVLAFLDWRLDLIARRLHTRDGTRVPLTSGEFELLVAFCEHANKVLTREQLLDFTRGRAAAGVDRSIDIQVSRLRRKIEKDPRDPVLIQTVRSGGYIFAAEVALE
jgi:two-component system, OmpR family, response regulator